MGAPGISVLQLDTRFSRIPGDVGCPQSYAVPLEILRVPRAKVGNIVTDRPENIDPAPFRAALGQAAGSIVTTSCGFLSPLQNVLSSATHKPFVASSLTMLPKLLSTHGAHAVTVITFDADAITDAHLMGATRNQVRIIGLGEDDHLRKVIENDRLDLDSDRAETELLRRLEKHLPASTRALLLECTNLPPYATALRHRFGLPVHDILTVIEANCPGTVAPAYLPPPSNPA